MTKKKVCLLKEQKVIQKTEKSKDESFVEREGVPVFMERDVQEKSG